LLLVCVRAAGAAGWFVRSFCCASFAFKAFDDSCCVLVLRWFWWLAAAWLCVVLCCVLRAAL